MKTVLQSEALWSMMLPAIINFSELIQGKMLIHLDTSQKLAYTSD